MIIDLEIITGVILWIEIFWICLTVYHGSRLRKIWMPSIYIVLTLFLLNYFVLYNRFVYYGVQYDKADYITRIPIYVATLIMILLGASSIYFTAAEYMRLTKEITKSSIKEAVDNVPAGIAFYDTDGSVVLSNREMNRLSLDILGHTISNGEQFFEEMREMYPKGYQRSEDSESIMGVYDNENRIYTINREEVFIKGERMYQLYALDATSLTELRNELLLENEKLKVINQKLRSYSESVTELTRDEEILRTKVRIHDDLGETLLATKYYLTQNRASGTSANLVRMWARNISLLKHESVNEEMTDPMLQIINAGEAIGLLVIVNGEIPKSNLQVLRIINAAARECMTNAVRHAQASELYIDIKREGAFYSIRFTDNGTHEVAPVREGGGLSGLRKNVEKAFGSMQINSDGRFELIIKIPN